MIPDKFKQPMRFKDARPASAPEEAQEAPEPQPTPQEQQIEDSETPATEQAESLVGVERNREADEEMALKERLTQYNQQNGPARQVDTNDVELLKLLLLKLLATHEGASDAAQQPPQPQQGTY